MKLRGILQMLALGLLATAAIRLCAAELQTLKRARLSDGLCQMAGNFLETDSIRDAYEAIQAGLARSGYPNACVAVIDNGRSYATNCLDAKIAYDTNICKAQGNIGIRAEVHFPVEPWLGWPFVALWAALTAALITTLFLCRKLAGKLISELSNEFRNRLIDRQKAGTVSTLGSLVDFFLKRTGIAHDVRAQVTHFEEQLREFKVRVREEEALRAKQEHEAERSLEYIEKVREIRHELRSPLSALLALQEGSNGSEEEAAALSSVVRRIRLLVDDLEQIDRAKEEPRLTIVEVVVEEAVLPLRKKFQQAKNVAIEVIYDPGKLTPVYAIPERFRGVIENLLDNAFDAVSHGGRITVTIAAEGPRCRLSVDDNGVGIPGEILEKLFVKGGTYGKVNGTGIGLFHARRTVESWNGEIRCEPLSRGTRFVVSIPLAQAGVTFVGIGNLKDVVVVDDDPVVEQALTAGGCRVLGSARTLDGGRRLLGGIRPEGCVALVDYRLGDDEFGTDLIEEQRERRSIVLCSNDFDDSVLLKKAKHLGVHVLPKPLCFLSGNSQSCVS